MCATCAPHCTAAEVYCDLSLWLSSPPPPSLCSSPPAHARRPGRVRGAAAAHRARVDHGGQGPCLAGQGGAAGGRLAGAAVSAGAACTTCVCGCMWVPLLQACPVHHVLHHRPYPPPICPPAPLAPPALPPHPLHHHPATPRAYALRDGPTGPAFTMQGRPTPVKADEDVSGRGDRGVAGQGWRAVRARSAPWHQCPHTPRAARTRPVPCARSSTPLPAHRLAAAQHHPPRPALGPAPFMRAGLHL